MVVKMAKSKKTWSEKYADANAKGHTVSQLHKDMIGMKAGQNMLIATPKMVADIVSAIPAGDVRDTRFIRQELANSVDADVTCPITTGIFLRMVVETAHEDYEAGCSINELVPFWRVMGEKAPIRKKVSFDLAPYLAQQEAECSAS